MAKRLCLCHGEKLTCYDIWAYIVVFVLAAMPQLLFILAFSALGYGEHFWSFLKDHHHTFIYFCASGAAVLLIMYLLDFSYWKGFATKLRNFLFAFVVLAIMIGAGLSAREYPSTPMLVFVCGGNFFFWFIRRHEPVKHLRHPQFLLGLSYSLAAASAATFIAWAYWVVAGKHYWNEETRGDFSSRMKCTKIDQATDAMTDTGTLARTDCLGALLLWFAPCIMACCNLVTATVVHLFGKHI